MAKICPNCGTENLDGVLYCYNCGDYLKPENEEVPVQQPTPAPEVPAQETPAQEATAQEATAPKATNPTMAKIDEFLAKIHLDRIKALIIGGAALTTIIILIVAISLLTGPKAVVRKLMNGFKDGDAKAIVNCMPSYYWDDDSDLKDDMIDELEEEFDYLDFDKFSYEIKRVSKLDEDEIEDLEDELEDMEDYYDELDADKVTAFREVKIKVTYKMDGERDTQTLKLILIKYKGQWKVYNFDGFF